MKKTLLRSLAMTALMVVGSIAANAKELIPFGVTSNQPWEGKYFYALRSAEEQAPENWYAADFDDTAWGAVTGPIDTGSLSYRNTTWQENYSSYWVRCHFTLDEVSDSKTYTFYAAHDDECVAYLNGVQIYNYTSVANYSTIQLTGEALAALKKGDNVLCVYVSDSGGGDAYMDFGLYENDLNDIVTRADVPVTITNDDTYPWAADGNTAIIRPNEYTSYDRESWLTLAFSSTYRTELTFEWACYRNGSHDNLRVYIDGVEQGSKGDNSYSTMRLYLEPGEHVVKFRDYINGYIYSSNFSGVRNIKVKEILPLETAVLTDNSQPLTFTNNSATPWTIEDGYIEHGNWCKQNVGATFSTSFTIDKTSKLSFNYKVANYNYDNSYNYENSHNLFVYINGVQITKAWNNISDTYWCVALEPGEYTVEWKDTVYTNNADWINYYTQIKDIELSNNWIDVELADAGTLGYEVIASGKADVLADVEFLKISGPMNASDWTNIKDMTNLKALDLSEAEITEIPNNAFDGKGWINSVILPEGLTRIGEYAFRGTSIRRINIPSTVTTIAQYAFNGTPIQYVTFADKSQCTTIANDAFYNCGSLQSVNFGENATLTTIGYGAFKNCSSLKEMILPGTVTSVGSAAFQYCTSIKTMHFSDAITDIAVCVCDGLTSLTDLHLPVNATIIRFASFNNTPSLRHIDLPSTLNDIYYRAFDGCGVDSVMLPINLQNLSEGAFQNCKNLKYIEFPSYLNTGSYSYHYHVYDAGNTYYTTTGYFGYRSNFTNCTALEKVVMRSATPPAITSDPFSGGRAKSAITLVVPSFSVVNYKLDSYWYQFGTIVEGDDVDYWKITSPLMLTNNRRMQGTPDVDLYYGGQLTVGGNAPFEMGTFRYYVNESNPGRLLNTCENMSADDASVRFYADANRWYFFTPLIDINLADIEVTNSASYVFRYYDAQNRAANGASGSWKNVDSDKLMAGQGYIFHCNTACEIVMPMDAAGQAQLFNTKDVTRTLTVNEAESTANRSWNYIGNPYPAYYDIYYMDFTAPITVWNGSTYQAYSVADDDFVLRPMQSFFVQKPDAVDKIVFKKEGRQLTTSIAHGAAARALAPARSSRYLFNLAISPEVSEDSEAPVAPATDQTRVVLNEEALLGYEIERDAAKFFSFDAAVPQLYTVDGEGNSYAINERPESDGVVILGYYAGKEGFYTIEALRADGKVSLYDAELNKTVDLSTEGYTFHSEATDGVNQSRFVLTFSVNNGGETTRIEEISNLKSQVSNLYDLQGRKTTATQKGIYVKDGRKVVNK